MTQLPVSHIAKGFMTVAVIIAISLVIEKTGIPVRGLTAYLPTLLLVAGVTFSAIAFSKQQRTTAFPEIFAHGFKTAAVVICLLAIYTYIHAKWLSGPPDTLTLENAKKELIEKGNIMPQEAEQKVKEALKNQWVFLVAQSIFSSLVAGTLGAAIGALISSKKKQYDQK
jgi:hypothetical protein